MKKENGITLVALIAVVAVLAILAGVVLVGVGNNYKETKQNTFESELRMVQNAVLQRKTQANLTQSEYDQLPGENISISEIEGMLEGVDLKGEEGEYKELNKSSLEQLGITNTEDTYIVNYKTGEVINKDKYDMFDTHLYISGE